MKTSLKIITGLLSLLLMSVIGIYLSSSPDVIHLAQVHQLDGLHEFLFGSAQSGVLTMNTPVLLTQFSRNIEELPVANNNFLKHAVDESQYVNGEKVKRPVAGGFPKSVTNPTVFPLKIEQKDDDSNEYNISLHATLPQRISDFKELQQSYASRQGVINRHRTSLIHKIARQILFDWSPSNSSSIIETTGNNKPAGLKSFGATGNRKMVTRDDILNAIQLLTEMDFEEGNFMLIPASYKTDIRKISEFVSYDKTGRPDGYSKSAIGEIEGVTVLVRSTGVIYDANGDPMEVDFNENTNRIIAADEACQGILLWNENSVFYGMGKMTPYIDAPSGTLLGSTVNFSQHAGGNIRKDGLGVVAIVEKTV